MAAIEHRDRQEIEDAEIDAEQSHEIDQIYPSGLHLLAGDLGDKDRPAEFRRRHHPLQDLDEPHGRQPNIHPGLAAGIDKGLDRTDPLVLDLVILDDADHVPLLDLLAEDVLDAVTLRHDRQRDLLLAPPDDHRQLPPLASFDTFENVFPMNGRSAVDTEDFVTGLETGGIGRRFFVDFPDQGGVDRLRNTNGNEQTEEQHNGKQQVEQRPGENDAESRRHRLVREGNPPVSLTDLLLIRVFAEHLDKAAERKGRNDILRFADHLADKSGTEPEGEFEDPHPKELGKDKVAQFMNEDEDTQNQDKRSYCIHKYSAPAEGLFHGCSNRERGRSAAYGQTGED